RILNNKSSFNVIDLGNNFHRFGPWGADLDWQRIFRTPNYYLDSLLNDEDLESNFKYDMPEELRKQFSNSEEVYFDINKAYMEGVINGESSKAVLVKSIAQHAKLCIENSDDVFDAYTLAKLLGDDIDYRIKRYTKCISKSTNNFVDWLREDYRKKLRAYLRDNFDKVYEEIHGHPPED
ncbi:MAG: DEAD/DEAH box helicase, partial [Flavobacteriaceae bacterium]|nr:DEAD/DEAH box helicase [Bacteroidia bacterium]NNL60540.1 DEAD/DEAH box helicase [Flavobacteriaceae bacterium]